MSGGLSLPLNVFNLFRLGITGFVDTYLAFNSKKEKAAYQAGLQQFGVGEKEEIMLIKTGWTREGRKEATREITLRQLQQFTAACKEDGLYEQSLTAPT